ncbi:MAG: hypothetical protein JKX92_05390 [Porticoccaceae bacterium]|nr:hypothetical protein [Porticoccaceae bacterium]
MSKSPDRYEFISEVPEGRRLVRGIPLQLFQINALVAKAKTDDGPFPVLFGRYRAEFEKSHHVVNGQWVPLERK